MYHMQASQPLEVIYKLKNLQFIDSHRQLMENKTRRTLSVNTERKLFYFILCYLIFNF